MNGLDPKAGGNSEDMTITAAPTVEDVARNRAAGLYMQLEYFLITHGDSLEERDFKNLRIALHIIHKYVPPGWDRRRREWRRQNTLFSHGPRRVG